MEIFLIIMIFISVLGVTVALNYKRIEQIEAFAQKWGFTFSRQVDRSFIRNLSHFHAFSQGHSGKGKNMMQGMVHGVKTAVFDYQYVTGSGKNRSTHIQTVMVMESDQLNLPSFSLRPENIFHKIGSTMGYQDIDFETHPTFSKSYLLRSSNESVCRALFTKDILDYYEQNKRLIVEGAGAALLYDNGSKISPENLEGFIGKGLEISALFKR